ncbi:MAG: PEP-CTERM sorting domain-containing protein, partial [Lacipirellulaceae bacterium]
LEVAAWGDYEPSLGDDFLVLAANEGFSGRFEDVVLPALGEGLAWYLDYTPNDLILSVVQDVFDADTNNSGQVDGFDFLAIQRGFGGPSPNPADATGDGYVNGADIARWQEQYGTNPSSKVGLGAVPEPSSLVLLSVLGLVALTKRR